MPVLRILYKMDIWGLALTNKGNHVPCWRNIIIGYQPSLYPKFQVPSSITASGIDRYRKYRKCWNAQFASVVRSRCHFRVQILVSAKNTNKLDLLEVFREYTEKGLLYKASSIISSQIANLETATRQIETKTRDINKTTISTNTANTGKQQTLTYAQIVSQGPHN
jgi:hypothetical protein